MKQPHTKRRLFLRTSVIGFGFLSGLWAHLGFNPQTAVFDLLSKVLVHFEPQYTQAVLVVFLVLPLILTSIGVLGAYRRAGLFGLLAVGLAFLSGLLLTLLSIPLLAAAVLIGFFAVRS